MYSVLEKTKQETVVPALKLSVPIEKESGFLVIESQIPSKTVDEVALFPAAFIKKESSFLGLSNGQLTAGAFGMSLVDLFLRDPALSGIGLLGGLMALAYPKLKKIKRGKWALHLMTLAGVASSGAMAMNLYTPPANALFFNTAQTFFNANFPLATTAINLIFNVFRAVYVIYLIYSAVSIWTAYNRDEEWMSVAKAPIVIFIAGNLIDAVTGVITT